MADKLLKTLDFGTGDVYRPAPRWEDIQNKPEDIGGGGSVDWDDVQNKPFGDIETVWCDGTFEFEYTDSDGACYACSNEAIKVGKSGELLSVAWDETSYQCEILADAVVAYFGNLSVFGIGEDNGMPFLGMIQDGYVMVLDLYAMETVTHTIKISKWTTKTIDTKYVQPIMVYYADDASKYLYKDTSWEKVTRTDYITAMSNYPLAISVYNDAIPTIHSVVASYVNEYGVAIIISDFKDGTPTYTEYYTAEYTG